MNMSAMIEDEFVGLWKRRSMVCDGQCDDTTVVYYLQTKCGLFADIRVPVPCIALQGQVGEQLAIASEEREKEILLTLSTLKGFGGIFGCDFTTNICRWNREIDFQPTASPENYLPDESLFRFENNGLTLIEIGIHEEFEEVWDRQTDFGMPTKAYRNAEGNGILVTVGDHFIVIINRATPIPLANSLKELVQLDIDSHNIGLAKEKLSLVVEYGRIRNEEDKSSYLVKYSTQLDSVDKVSTTIAAYNWVRID